MVDPDGNNQRRCIDADSYTVKVVRAEANQGVATGRVLDLPLAIPDCLYIISLGLVNIKAGTGPSNGKLFAQDGLQA